MSASPRHPLTAVGAGRVGAVVGAALAAARHRVVTVADRSPAGVPAGGRDGELP